MEQPKRKQTRLGNFDYGQNGAYFITICTQNRERILSDIIVGEGFPLPRLTAKGKIAENLILAVNEKFHNVKIDNYIIMPDHIHIIIQIQNGIGNPNGRGDPSPTVVTVGNVVGWLKYSITKQINEAYGMAGNKIFQRSYHDHIIRNQQDYNEVWEYIENNPAKWVLTHKTG
ncbi:MAG: transposase [Clostridia bacterium]|nr:transposase [Clostridia bacterium]